MTLTGQGVATTAIIHTKNCQTKNLWAKIPKSLRWEISRCASPPLLFNNLVDSNSKKYRFLVWNLTVYRVIVQRMISYYMVLYHSALSFSIVWCTIASCSIILYRRRSLVDSWQRRQILRMCNFNAELTKQESLQHTDCGCVFQRWELVAWCGLLFQRWKVANMVSVVLKCSTVSFHNCKSQNFKLSVSNPKSKYVAYLSVPSQI